MHVREPPLDWLSIISTAAVRGRGPLRLLFSSFFFLPGSFVCVLCSRAFFDVDKRVMCVVVCVMWRVCDERVVRVCVCVTCENCLGDF